MKNFTGIDAPYEVPENPELRIQTESVSPQDGADQIIAYLMQQGIVSPVA